VNIIATADLHLTDKPADEHRWGLFPWLVQQAQKHGAGMIVLAGDITDAKNFHSSVLTNKMVTSLRMLSAECPVYVLRGNHDYTDENEPFFNFVSKFKHISFVTAPTTISDESDENILLLPNTRNYQEAWKGQNFNGYKYIFTHQTYDGAKSETDFALTGIPPSVFAKTKAQIFSGDIHVPQKIGKNIEYIGAPYRIRFGDSFTPRVLLIREDGTTKDLHFPTKNKMTIDLVGGNNVGPTPLADCLDSKPSAPFNVSAGDQVKVRVHMQRSAYPEWPEVKRKIIAEAVDMGIELHGPELVAVPEQPKKAVAKARKGATGGDGPLGALGAYAERKALPDAMTRAGEDYLKAAMK
jgi:predicted phosphodiesterase